MNPPFPAGAHVEGRVADAALRHIASRPAPRARRPPDRHLPSISMAIWRNSRPSSETGGKPPVTTWLRGQVEPAAFSSR